MAEPSGKFEEYIEHKLSEKAMVCAALLAPREAFTPGTLWTCTEDSPMCANVHNGDIVKIQNISHEYPDGTIILLADTPDVTGWYIPATSLKPYYPQR